MPAYLKQSRALRGMCCGHLMREWSRLLGSEIVQLLITCIAHGIHVQLVLDPQLIATPLPRLDEMTPPPALKTRAPKTLMASPSSRSSAASRSCMHVRVPGHVTRVLR